MTASHPPKKIHIAAYIATLSPAICSVPLLMLSLKLGATGPLITVICIVLLQCIGFTITLICGKAQSGLLPGTKPLLWVNVVALIAYPALMLFWVFAAGNAMSGINA